MFNGKLYKNSPSYSISRRSSIDGAYVPKQYIQNKYGSESPGVGSYSPDVSAIHEQPVSSAIGQGPKCPASNFEFPNISPGPIYSNIHPLNISQRIKVGKVISILSKYFRILQWEVPKECSFFKKMLQG